VTELYVIPEKRGRGVGSRLLRAITTRMRAAGAGALHLLVRPENRGARRLYSGVGFKVVPRLMMTKAFAVVRHRRPPDLAG
jgi:ribosomal protein S18 acetylase RimI-like enzyme